MSKVIRGEHWTEGWQKQQPAAGKNYSDRIRKEGDKSVETAKRIENAKSNAAQSNSKITPENKAASLAKEGVNPKTADALRTMTQPQASKDIKQVAKPEVLTQSMGTDKAANKEFLEAKQSAANLNQLASKPQKTQTQNAVAKTADPQGAMLRGQNLRQNTAIPQAAQNAEGHGTRDEGRKTEGRRTSDERRATSDEKRATSDERRETRNEKRATSDEQRETKDANKQPFVAGNAVAFVPKTADALRKSDVNEFGDSGKSIEDRDEDSKTPETSRFGNGAGKSKKTKMEFGALMGGKTGSGNSELAEPQVTEQNRTVASGLSLAKKDKISRVYNEDEKPAEFKDKWRTLQANVIQSRLEEIKEFHREVAITCRSLTDRIVGLENVSDEQKKNLLIQTANFLGSPYGGGRTNG